MEQKKFVIIRVDDLLRRRLKMSARWGQTHNEHISELLDYAKANENEFREYLENKWNKP